MVAEVRNHEEPKLLLLDGFSGSDSLCSEDSAPPSASQPPFVYHRTILQIEPGRLNLHLTKPVEVQVDPSTLECEVIGWSIKLPARNIEQLPQALTRRFLELFSKADAGSLSEKEENQWVSILDRIDYQAFCIDRASPHYVEGVIVTKQPSYTLVDWHDGVREKLDFRVGRSLGFLEKNESFGAWVKLGRDNNAVEIQNVTILP